MYQEVARSSPDPKSGVDYLGSVSMPGSSQGCLREFGGKVGAHVSPTSCFGQALSAYIAGKLHLLQAISAFPTCWVR